MVSDKILEETFTDNFKGVLSSNNHPDTIFYMLPPTAARLASVNDVMEGNQRPERYLFYGMDYLIRQGMSVRDNIRDHRPPMFLTWRVLWIYRKFIKMFGAYGGALEWVLPYRRACASANLLFVYSDRLMFPIINLRLMGLLPRIPTVYIAMGLPEKFEQFRNKSRQPLYLAEFAHLDKIISLSKSQADILKSRYGLKNIAFIHDGVDTDYFAPVEHVHEVDVLSIGADPFRDFKTLLEAVEKLPSFSFRIITSRPMANTLPQLLPANVEVLVDVPMGTIRDQMARCKLLALPVRDNTYSGATTVLLQAMSMGKAVIANPVGANRDGYPFEDGTNCIMVPAGETEALVLSIRSLIENPARRTAVGERARETVLYKLNINLFHKKLLEVLSNVSLNKSVTAQ